MNDFLQKFLSLLKSFPVWLRAVFLLLVAVLILLLSFSSCGLTRASVRNKAEGTTTEIKITTSNPTNVTATPNVELKSTDNGN